MKIIDKINETLPDILENPYNFDNAGESVFPLIDYACDLEIAVGEDSVSVIVYFQKFHYSFNSVPYNEDKGFTKDYVAYMHGTSQLGYAGAAWYNPANEEVAELFDMLKIEELKLPVSWEWGTYKNYFNTFCWENTVLYF